MSDFFAATSTLAADPPARSGGDAPYKVYADPKIFDRDLREARRSLRLRKHANTNRIEAAYDAAQTTDANRHYWAKADLLSADSANSPEVRRTLRSRARYECLEANPFATGMVNTLANDTIGRGPSLQMMLEDDGQNEEVERSFSRWSKRVKLAKKLRTARKAKFVDGELFIRFITNPRLRGRVKLDLEVIECDRVCATFAIGIPQDLMNYAARFGIDPESLVDLDGVIFDMQGNRIAYRVLKDHPGTTHLLASVESEIVPASQMIHLFRENRPGQHRGIPECTTALPLFILSRDYTLAVVQHARSVAKHTVLWKTQAGAVYQDGETFDSTVDAFDQTEIDYDMQVAMPFGWEPVQLRAEQPATTYEMFRNAIWNEIARCADMPFNIASGNSADYNYASGRLDHQTYDMAIDVERSDWEIDCLDVIFEAWLDEALLAGEVAGQLGEEFDDVLHEWHWPGRGHVDPAKESIGQANRLKSGTTHRGREYKKEGLDVRKEDAKAAKDLGLTLEEYRRLVAGSIFGSDLLEDDDDGEEPSRKKQKTTAAQGA